ncbi:hypothetical protein [Paenibacillus shenyangensis]|uniref:hypothetical protein n=1 Tax=Paenibacillus sp. A9 TaxID=1284352 RepID=UPI00036C18EF|nr:hypothetical protein [Paenibacillus sp. A9]
MTIPTLTPEQAEKEIPRYEQAVQEDRVLVNRLKRQIADLEDKLLKGRKTAYTMENIEQFKKQLTEWRIPSLESAERELHERKLLVSGWTWEQIIADREQPAQEEAEPSLF